MADPEKAEKPDKIKLLDEKIEALEKMITKRILTREMFEEVEDESFDKDVTFSDFVQNGIISGKYIWEGDYLVPDYEHATKHVSLSANEIESLKMKSQSRGKMPQDILKEIIYVGLSTIGKGNT